ncbi:riboflavin-binding protein-like [Lacerta agilis]|uniref:riboflavin-binding protein-like n=1 Tax=Lacerta agilis TaxID=80427 RepID=UPI0014196102|nr:riboflavin-binding protein-like [Lacerta agilis]XP_033008146.1 riboflavin-binding protein-like [Lacerta agilis]
MLRFSVPLFFAILAVSISGKRQCLEGAAHKLRPSQENNLHECTLYSKSSCCSEDITKELADSPVIKVNTTYWNRCGNNSKLCQSYMKKIECFYRCSPYTAHWAHPLYAAAIVSVPMCQNFCDDWYEACKNDFTCVSNWLTDWAIDEKGENHCKNACIPYHEMYGNGTDMCKSMWGDSLKVSDSPCLCLQMDEMDSKVVKLLEERASGNSSSSSRSDEEQFCRLKLDKIKKLKEPKDEGVETF